VAITQGTLEIGRRLKLKVVAEGVQTPEGGASSLTPMQLRDCAIDSQVLFIIGWSQ
jgi:hypothetical protein